MKPVKQKKCRFCGNPFTPYMTTDRFCSSKCAVSFGMFKSTKQKQYNRVRRPKDPDERIKAKAEARVRDRGRCMLKGYVHHDKHKIGREEHHIIYLSEGGPDIVWNLITLCTHCHHEIVHKSKKKWQKRLFIILHGYDWYEKIPKEGLSEAVLKKLTFLADQ